MFDIKKEVAALENELITLRRDFHAHPELGYQEFLTSKKICGYLTALGLEDIQTITKTGVTAILRGTKGEGKTIMLRADMDALPVEEMTGLPFASQNKGVMHACGHDFHLTTIYGVALLLNENAAQLHGTVKLLFQPAEESSLGALKIIETGVLDDVNAIFGIHSTSQFEVGTIGIKAGTISAAVDRFKINLKGFGSHAAHPQMAKDPIVFAMANPVPEIMPDVAKKAGVRVIGTGRSDFPNQINNVLAFPGIFRGALDVRASDINDEMKMAAAQAIADIIKDDELNDEYIIPDAFDKRVAENVAKAVAKAARESGVARI